MRLSVDGLRHRFYPPGESRARDGSPEFDEMLFAIAKGGRATALNLGAGPGPVPNREMRGQFTKLVGVDIDPSVKSNLDLDEAHVTDGVHLPFPDATFDVVYSDWTVEHIQWPSRVLDEVHRVLQPGAPFIFRTPNLLHYVSLVSWATPHSFHQFVARSLRTSVPIDPWPTFYRMNTHARTKRLLRAAGFEKVQIQAIEPEPSYLAMHPLTFGLGIAYERLLNSTSALGTLRHIMVVRTVRGESASVRR